MPAFKRCALTNVERNRNIRVQIQLYCPLLRVMVFFIRLLVPTVWYLYDRISCDPPPPPTSPSSAVQKTRPAWRKVLTGRSRLIIIFLTARMFAVGVNCVYEFRFITVLR
jgi:hypothetical protein